MIRFGLAAPVLLTGMALLWTASRSIPSTRLLRVMTVSIGRFEAFDNVSREADPVYNQFLEIFSNRLGVDPLFATLVLSVCFYAYAAGRRVPFASECLAGALASMAMIGPDTLIVGLLSSAEMARPAPLLAAAGILLFVGIRQRNPWNLLRGTSCLAGFIALAVPLPSAQPDLGLHAAIFVHLHAVVNARAGRRLRATRTASPFAASGQRLFSSCLWPACINGSFNAKCRRALPIVYPLCMGIPLAGVWTLLARFLGPDDGHDRSGLLGLQVRLDAVHRSLRGMVRGFDYLLSGFAFFMIGVLVEPLASRGCSRVGSSQCWLPAWPVSTLAADACVGGFARRRRVVRGQLVVFAYGFRCVVTPADAE